MAVQHLESAITSIRLLDTMTDEEANHISYALSNISILHYNMGQKKEALSEANESLVTLTLTLTLTNPN